MSENGLAFIRAEWPGANRTRVLTLAWFGAFSEGCQSHLTMIAQDGYQAEL